MTSSTQQEHDHDNYQDEEDETAADIHGIPLVAPVRPAQGCTQQHAKQTSMTSIPHCDRRGLEAVIAPLADRVSLLDVSPV
jgi:hypothetical protein